MDPLGLIDSYLFTKFNEFLSTRTWRLHLKKMMRWLFTKRANSKKSPDRCVIDFFAFTGWKGSKLKRPPKKWMIWMFLLSNETHLLVFLWCYSWYHVVFLLVFAKQKSAGHIPAATMSCWRCIWRDEMMLNQAKLQAQQQNFQIASFPELDERNIEKPFGSQQNC